MGRGITDWFGALEGTFVSAERLWLRWYDAQGHWIPTNAERAQKAEEEAIEERQRADREQQERQQAEQRASVAEQQRQQAQQQAEKERQRAERLAQMLRDRGIDPDNS